VASRTGAEIRLEKIAERRPGGLAYNHPLARNARAILNKLNIKPRISPSTAELSAFIYNKIPALTVGITNGGHLNEENETIRIEPISVGIAQLLGLLLVIDRGFADEH